MDKTQQTEIDAEKRLSIKKSKAYTDSIKLATLTITDITSPDGTRCPDTKKLYRELKKRINKVTIGDTSDQEIILASQAKTLDLLFHNMVSKAAQSKFLESTERYLEIAFRAQNQCRKTLLVINTIKHPQQQTVFNQQNLAFNQQVNNKMVDNEKTEIHKIKSENELISEAHYEKLDFARTPKTGSIDQIPETLAMVNRCKNSAG